MADINRIIALIDKYLESTGQNRVEANEISVYLEKNGALSHFTKGQPLRKLLRESRIPNAEQPGGKGTSWYIHHSNSKGKTKSSPIKLNSRKIPSIIKKSVTYAMSVGLEPVADSESEYLILGTLPGKVSLQTQHYYANSSNYFWRIISCIFDEAIPDSYEERLSVLKKHHIALWDILKSADRESSLDSDIKNPSVNDILGFISVHPNLKVVGFNGKEAEEYFRRFIGIHNLPENIRAVSLPSSSSSNTHLKLDTKTNLWETMLKS